ncbi:uncharacterized protein LOC127877450 [Dreissena polymorpha]|uniref:Uncharacterized protein n=1 Tax=Dreissena polymorpha TaxID=45954 RepID=A0A9D4KCW8_DREPO|nr:uncharacterized protein LOC127877450 [Dreissena polymorpha]XP_052279314.1 uncharacterized protein LOC127877450 [Dreissena polymorpha]KAH3837094.1 hypothetical protein DPMN_110472 [Dreissena polymorpha]
MKLTLGMEEAKTSYPVTISQPGDLQKGKPKFVRNVAIAFIGFVLVAVVIVVAVYFGIRLTKDTYQEAWHTFRDKEGHYMEEKVNKTKDMTEIHVPNSVHVIYDYVNGISVERFTDVQTKIRGPCYVRFLNSSKTNISPDTDQTTDDAGPYDNKVESQHWKLTDRKVPSYLTSAPRVQEMCKDTDIFWMEEVPESSIQKRQASGYQCNLIIYRTFTYNWVRYLYKEWVCYLYGRYAFNYWELWRISA